MKYLWKRATGLLLTSALVLGLAACGGTPTGNTNPPEDPGTQQTTQPVAPDSGAAGEKLVYSNGGPEEFFETPWLNPGTYVYNKAVYGHLIVADENLNPIPNHPDALATYEYSADGKTLTFTLRDDAYWHNGEKVTPEDIKWSIEFVAKTPVANAVFISTFSAIAGSKTGDTFNDTFSGIAIDGQKIIITFDKIAPDALLTFTQFAPVPKSEFEGIDPLQVQQAPFFQHPIGCGPFMVEEVNMKNYTILAPFDRYYNGVADFKIQLLPSAGDSDPNVVTRAKSGNLDYGYTKMVADVQALEGTPGITVTPIDVRYTRLFYLNKFDKKDGSPAPLADVRVRQALRYAIDMETICETLFQGSAVPANALAPDANLKGGDLNDYNYNPEKAKELLAEAGYPDGFSTTLWCSDTQVMRDSAVVIQEQLRQVGINAEVKTLESGQFQSETGNGAHDMFIMSKTSIDPDSMLRSMYHTEALGPSGNRCFWTTPEVDALIDEASTTTDTEHAMELYAEIQSKVAEAAPLVPMAVEHLNAGMQSNVKGFGLYPGKSHYINGTYFE